MISLNVALLLTSTRPGDHVIWKGEDEQRAAIVQSVNASDRIALILFPDSSTTDIVSVLELDPHGTADFSVVNSQYISEGLGVRRGEFVLIHSEGTTNGLEKPRVPRIGEVEAWAREPPEAGGQFSGWRKALTDIGTQIAARRAAGIIEESEILNASDSSLEWFGVVTEVSAITHFTLAGSN